MLYVLIFLPIFLFLYIDYINDKKHIKNSLRSQFRYWDGQQKIHEAKVKELNKQRINNINIKGENHE